MQRERWVSSYQNAQYSSLSLEIQRRAVEISSLSGLRLYHKTFVPFYSYQGWMLTLGRRRCA
jgi:hypothetical protein